MTLRRLAATYLAVCVLLACGWQVIAQNRMPQMGVATQYTVSTPTYTGPGDVITTNWKAWWGFRAFSSADRGNKLANVCNSTGGVDVLCADFSSDASTGLMDVTTIGGVTCTTNCTIKTLYDRSGATACTGSVACDMTQATIASRPVLVPSCLNSNACMSCNRTVPQIMNTVAAFPTLATLTISLIGERTGGTTNFSNVLGDGSNSVQSGFSNSANNALMYASTIVSISGVNDNAVHAMGLVYNTTSSIYNIDSATGTVSPGNSSFSTNSNPGPGFCTSAAGGNPLTGNVWEAGVNSATLTAGNLVSLNTNLHAAYGGF